MRFRNFDTTPTRTQKLELLREKVAAELVTIAVTIEGIPTATQRLLRYRTTQALDLVAASSLGDADIAATASTVFTVKINGVTAGTITFGAGQTVGVAAFTVTAVPLGALLEIYAPGSVDATLSNITLALAATKP